MITYDLNLLYVLELIMEKEENGTRMSFVFQIWTVDSELRIVILVPRRDCNLQEHTPSTKVNLRI